MTRRYKTSYKSRRISSRFTVTFDAAAIAKHVQETCTLCNGTIEESPMLRGVCYNCYHNLVQSPETFTALSNHVACTLSDSMRDCDNCEFQPDVEPWNVIPDTVTLPPAKNNTLQALADARNLSFNAHYYGNNGLPYFPHQKGQRPA